VKGLAKSTKSGYPGEWGDPRECIAVMNSPLSKNVTEGARVRRYRQKGIITEEMANISILLAHPDAFNKIPLPQRL
jgi:hypothetical protein